MTPESDAVERLRTVLEAEERLYREMRSLLQEERGHFLALRVDDIERSVRRKEALAEEGRLLEECRREVAAELAADLGLGEGDVRLPRLCEALGPRAAELATVHGRLVALVGAVRELVQASQGSAGEALHRVQAVMKLLGRLAPELPAYGYAATSSPATGRSAGHIVRQAV